jgi:hypothetical protein
MDLIEFNLLPKIIVPGISNIMAPQSSKSLTFDLRQTNNTSTNIFNNIWQLLKMVLVLVVVEVLKNINQNQLVLTMKINYIWMKIIIIIIIMKKNNH